jgi:ribosomal protection tetracycline resistance protein
MPSLNLGILAHVDAGKTTLTERLLYEAGVLDRPGSVDAGTTRTDSMDLERQRGITIRSAVTSFDVGDRTVNLIDTPGHPDFIAEVERALTVLDGAVLVVSAVEAVQSQTVVLWRALERLGVPTLMFVNKADRTGADPERVAAEIAERLTSAAVSFVDGVALPSQVETLAAYDEELLDLWARGVTPGVDQLCEVVRRRVADAALVPVLAGSARDGTGVAELTDAIATWLPAAAPAGEDAPTGSVFKIERDEQGKRAFVRMRDGHLHVRERVSLSGRDPERVTGLTLSTSDGFVERPTASAGDIVVVRGLESARVGDSFGAVSSDRASRFPTPVLETVVRPVDPSRRGAMYAALSELAEQDPLIALHPDETTGEVAVKLYGEVQKDVIGTLLATEYGVDVTFDETSVVYIERVVGTGASVERIQVGDNPYLATVGVRVDPLPIGSGVTFSLEVEAGAMPPAFFTATEEGVRSALRQGLSGWSVEDCAVAMTDSGYWARQSHAHQKFNKAFSTVAADFRRLAPVVVMAALEQARTQVCEPVDRFTLEVPTRLIDPVIALVTRLGGVPVDTEFDDPAASSYTRIVGHLPAAGLHALTSRLPDVTGGTGALTSELDHYRPVHGDPPVRRRSGPDPRDRQIWFQEMPR